MTVKIEGAVDWTYYQDPESGWYIGVCECLNITAYGETMQEMQVMGIESLHLMFTELYQEGEFEKFLQEHGWEMESAPSPQNEEIPEFDIPMNFDRTTAPIAA